MDRIKVSTDHLQGFGATQADMKRGFIAETLPDEYVDLNGENRTGEPCEFGGFAGKPRPRGFER